VHSRRRRNIWHFPSAKRFCDRQESDEAVTPNCDRNDWSGVDEKKSDQTLLWESITPGFERICNIIRHRNREVIERGVGASFADTLVSDFYAAYHGLDCPKQRCLVHLLRELAKLREELPWQSVRAFIQPLIDLFRDATQLGKDRERLSSQAFARGRQRILDRFDDLVLNKHTRQRECLRIWRRLFRHFGELFTFLGETLRTGRSVPRPADCQRCCHPLSL